MRREKNQLIFEPNEEDRWLKAISLYGRFRCKHNKDSPLYEKQRAIISDTIEHERAHLQEIHRLGYGDKIANFVLMPKKKGYVARINFFNVGLEDNLYSIVMAPKDPSKTDLETAKRELIKAGLVAILKEFTH